MKRFYFVIMICLVTAVPASGKGLEINGSLVSITSIAGQPPGRTSIPTTIQLTDNGIRNEQAGHVSVIDFKDNVIRSWKTPGSTYSEVSIEEMKRRNLAGVAQRKKLQEQAKKILDQRGDSLTLKVAGKEKILGILCTHYQIFRGETIYQEFWATADFGPGIYMSQNISAFHGTDSSIKKIYEKIKGNVVQYKMYVKNKFMESTVSLTPEKITQKNLTDAILSPPADYVLEE